MVVAIFFPNQLLDIKHVRKLVKEHHVSEIVIWEDPCFFGERRGDEYPSDIPLNKLRLAYMHVCNRLFAKRLEDAKLPVKIVKNYVPSGNRFVCYDPCDKLISKKLASVSATVIDSPQFILTSQECIAFGGGKRKLVHKPFFDMVKSKIQFLEGVSSTDKENRKPLPKEAGVAPSPYLRVPKDEHVILLWAEAKSVYALDESVDLTYFKQLPMSPKQARQWFQKFLDERFSNFAKYEDAIADGQPWLYHSGISIFLNNGLLTPSDVLDSLRKLKRNPNVEAFVRQVFGWREYARMYYLSVPATVARKNVFKNKALLGQSWWAASTATPLPPVVQDAVNDAWNMGYLHHIRRLMVVSNFMTLNNIHPDEVYRWMYAFALDAWSWVMVFNVYSMGTWSDGGVAMRKPYVSSSAYLRRMGRLGSGTWATEWDAYYKAFISKHQNILKHTVLAQHSS